MFSINWYIECACTNLHNIFEQQKYCSGWFLSNYKLIPVYYFQRVFDHLMQSNKKIKVTCEYLQKYIKNNGDKYKDNILQ